MLHDKELTFVRYGGLSPVIQKGYKQPLPGFKKLRDTKPGFHEPPAKKGVYAFVKGAEERFLLGGDSYSGVGTKNPKWEYLKDKNGNRIEDTDDVHDDDIMSMRTYDIKKLQKKYGIKFPKARKISSVYDEETKKSYLTTLKEPKYFKYRGEIWHHLKDFVKPTDVLDEYGDWIKTTTDVHRKAFEKAWLDKKKSGYMGNDEFEVFIERVP